MIERGIHRFIILYELLLRGIDCCICSDDLSKHSKSYRQISLISAKIPSRDAFPADIFNIHSSLLERRGKLKYSSFGGSITGSPVIETINSDTTEYIATNVIPITDGQSYTNKRLFLDSNRPAIDSALSVSRIGSNAQCKLMKVYSVGIKNLPTHYRNMELSSNDLAIFKLIPLNPMSFQDHPLISPLETPSILLMLYRLELWFRNIACIHRLLFIPSIDSVYLYHILFISKTSYSLWSVDFISSFVIILFTHSSIFDLLILLFLLLLLLNLLFLFLFHLFSIGIRSLRVLCIVELFLVIFPSIMVILVFYY